MSSNSLFVAGRVLMAVIFVVAGVRKLLAFSATAGYFAKLGIPLSDVVLALTIMLEIGGALALIVGWRIPVVAAALGAFCIASGLLAHRFWAAEPAQFASQLNHLLKNLAMAGGFMVVAALALQQRSSQPART